MRKSGNCPGSFPTSRQRKAGSKCQFIRWWWRRLRAGSWSIPVWATIEGRNVPTWNNRKTPFLETMTAAGFPPDSIDTVLCTHLYVDHVGWNTKLAGGKWVPTFANARYVFGKTEFEHWRDHSDEPDKIAVFDDSVKPIADAGKADLVASDARLCDEITLIPTPGHRPG